MIALGVGLSSAASAAELAELADAALSGVGLSRADVDVVGTLDRLAADPRVLALNRAVHGFTQTALTAVSTSVCEAAAMLAVAPPSTLLVPKVKGRYTTVAVACSASSGTCSASSDTRSASSAEPTTHRAGSEPGAPVGPVGSSERRLGAWPDSPSFC